MSEEDSWRRAYDECRHRINTNGRKYRLLRNRHNTNPHSECREEDFTRNEYKARSTKLEIRNKLESKNHNSKINA